MIMIRIRINFKIIKFLPVLGKVLSPPLLNNASSLQFRWQTLSKIYIAFHCWPVDVGDSSELPIKGKEHIVKTN